MGNLLANAQFRPGDDIKLNTSDTDAYELASATRSKKVIAFTRSDLFRKQLCISCVSSSPRWLLARTFESLKNEERKAKFPDVVPGSFGVQQVGGCVLVV